MKSGAYTARLHDKSLVEALDIVAGGPLTRGGSREQLGKNQQVKSAGPT